MDQKLYKAAKEGDVRPLSEIDGRNITEEEAMRIQDGIFLNRTQHGNNNILHIAARAGRDTFVVEALRRFPFLSDQLNSQGDTPLLVAARFGHLQVVKTLADPNNELPIQDHDTATAVESGTNSRSSRPQRDVDEGLVNHQLEQCTVEDNVAIVENGTNSRDMTTALENETKASSSRRPRDVEEGLDDHQLHKATSLENGTNSRDMTTALENETNSSSSRRPRDVEEGLDDHQLEQGTIQDGMATAVENGTNLRGMATALENETILSSSRRPRDVEEGLDDYQLEAGTIQDGMATAVENGTNSRDMATVLENVTNSSSRHPRDVEEGLDDHQLEQDTIQDNVTTVENGTNSSNISRRKKDVEEGLLDDQLEQATSLENGTNSRDMTTALENETNSSSSRHPRDVEEGPDDYQLEAGMATAVENGTNSRDMATVHVFSAASPNFTTTQLTTGADQKQKQKTHDWITPEPERERERAPLSTIEMAWIPRIPIGFKPISTAVENGTNSRDMATTSKYETNSSSSSRRQRDVEKVLVDRQLIHGTTALHEALRNGHEEVARYLLKLDPEMATLVTGAGESPLFLAAESRCESFMLHILQSNRSYSTKGPDGLNVLHAARDYSVKIISDLISQNPDLMRQRDDHGKAAIHYAAEVGYSVLFNQILEADPSIALFPDNDGHTPLLGAASSRQWDFCRNILKTCPESIEARNHEGRHVLHLCKFRDVRFLMRRIPAILELLNEGDKEGNTPLHLAIKEKDYEKARLLASLASIELGAVNKEGLTALDLSCQTDEKNSYKKKLMWLHLAACGAPRGRLPIKYKVPEREGVADYKPLINTIALVATLIATVTFAAAFTMPGGYDTSPDNLGVANLVKIAALKAFIVSDTIAMSCSITTVLTLALSVNRGQESQRRICIMSWVLVGLAMRGTLVAFMCCIFVVIAPKALWVAIFVCIICGIASFAVELSFPIVLSPIIIAHFRYHKQRQHKAVGRKLLRKIGKMIFWI